MKELFEKVNLIIDEFGTNGVFKANSYPLVLSNNAVQWRGATVYTSKDTHTPASNEITDAINFFYKNALSYRIA